MTSTYSMIVDYAVHPIHDHDNEPRPFGVMVCVDEGDVADHWYRLDDFNGRVVTRDPSVKIKMLGVIGFVTIMANGLRLTIIMRGIGPIMGYWNTAALVAGTTVGFVRNASQSNRLDPAVQNDIAVPEFLPVGEFFGGSGSFVLNTCIDPARGNVLLSKQLLSRPPERFMIHSHVN